MSFSANHEDIGKSAGKLVSVQTEIEGLLKTAQAEVATLVEGGFVTEAASGAFQTSYEEFNKGIGEALEGLSGMSRYLQGASTTIKEVDQKLAQVLK